MTQENNIQELDQMKQQLEMLKKKLLEISPLAKIKIDKTRGLCSFYAEKGGLLVGFEKAGC